VTYFLNLPKGSYQQELDNYFDQLKPNNLLTQSVSKSALCQARQQLSPTAFIDLNHRVMRYYYAHHSNLKTWHGHRLCAIDGSQMRLPNSDSIVDAFGVNPGKENQKDCPMALASVYYDVLNHLSIDSSINNTKTSERECAASHLKFAQPNDLSILDRGYNGFWLYALYNKAHSHFCMRAKVNRGIQFKAFEESGLKEVYISMTPNKSSIQQCIDKGLSTKLLTLRLIRVELDNEVEVLVTNLLDNEHYPASEFKELYHLRWGVEENYKRLKKWIEIENFTGKSALSVKQDFYARVLSSNLISILVNAAQHLVDEQTSDRKLPYQVNFAQAISKAKNTIVELIVIFKSRLKERLIQLIGYIACTHEPVRNNRSYPRIKRRPNSHAFYMNYKRAK
jgi:hypothetical protein